MKIRTGIGYDVHRMATGYELWLGGIKLEFEKGSVGHSDADVLIHVICDALLGAANMRDIGYHFSDKDPKYKGIDSKILLTEVVGMLRAAGWEIQNVDSVVCLEQPKVNPHIPEMKTVLAKVMGLEEDQISIKATTSEKMGFVGREEGVSAYATALITQ